MLDKTRNVTISDTYNPLSDVVLYEGDCNLLLSEIPAGSVDLIVTSPPYNIGKTSEILGYAHKYIPHPAPKLDNPVVW